MLAYGIFLIMLHPFVNNHWEEDGEWEVAFILHFLNINIQFLYSYLGILTYNCEANVIRSTSTMLRLEIESVEKRKEVEMLKSKTTRLFSCKERKSTGMSDFPAFFGVKYVRITFLIFPLGLVFSRNSFYKKHKNLQGILFLR